MNTIVTKGLIDNATSGQKDGLLYFGALLVALMLSERGMYILVSRLRINTSIILQKSMQGNMMSELLARQYSGLKRYHSGQLVSRVFSDVGVIKQGIISILPNICTMLVSFFGAAAILATMDWKLVTALVLGTFVGSGLMLFFRGPMKRRHKRMQEAQSKLHASIQQTLSNIRLIKASLSQTKILQRVNHDQQKLQQEQRRHGYFSIAMNHGLGLMFDVSWLVCMIWGCINIFHGNMTYGALAAMIQLIGRIQGPVAGAADMFAQIYGVTASAERLQDLLQIEKEKAAEPVHDFDCIRLNDVSFHYDDSDEPVLQHISFDIQKHDFVALTGISGGGKTTLFQLLLGLFAPRQGTVTFEQGNEKHNASRSTRSLLAYVPQGNTLISGSLRQNLTLFSGQMTDEQIIRCAAIACIDHLIDEIGLDAMIGERGVGLSQGQAQRVSIARALLSNAPILLLDEATSALDDETEARLLRNLSELKQKTCVIVTHRSAALNICNRHIHIADGRIQTE